MSEAERRPGTMGNSAVRAVAVTCVEIMECLPWVDSWRCPMIWIGEGA
jgi:hypothetical protein